MCCDSRSHSSKASMMQYLSPLAVSCPISISVAHRASKDVNNFAFCSSRSSYLESRNFIRSRRCLISWYRRPRNIPVIVLWSFELESELRVLANFYSYENPSSRIYHGSPGKEADSSNQQLPFQSR